MDVKHVFETTLFDEGRDLALAVLSVAPEAVTAQVESPEAVMRTLKVTPVAEVPSQALGDLLAAVLATTDVDDTFTWLLEPPNPVELIPLDRPGTVSYGQLAPDMAWGDKPPEKAALKLEKGSSRAQELEAFAKEAAASGFVPFRESPLDFYPLWEILEGQDELRAYLVTVRKTPLAFLWLAGGFLLVNAVVGAGKGIRSGLSAGLRYRILQRFGLPDDIIRDEMRRRREDEAD